MREVGLEWDTSAVRTRAAAGHATIQCDVSAYPVEPFIGRTTGATISPPCTKLSAAGTGIGRRFLVLLAGGIRRMMRGEDCRAEIRAAIYPVALEEQRRRNAKRRAAKRWSEEQLQAAARDDAFVTALMLEPARYLHALICRRSGGIPLEWAALEQVPAAMPLWQVYVGELRRLGWSAVAGVLNLADYGGGQDRPRAVLAASSVRPVALPAPTHGELWGEDLFGGRILPQVTMAQALGWGYTQRPAPTVTGGGTATGGAEPFGNGSRKAMHAAMADPRHWAWKRPAHTVSGTVGHVGGKQAGGHLNLEPEEGAVLQTFPRDYPFQGNKGQRSRQIGDAVPPLLAMHVVAAATGLPLPAHIRQEAAA